MVRAKFSSFYFILSQEEGSMEELLTEVLTSQGIWAALFVSLLLYTIRKNDKLDELQDCREKEYQKLLLELTDKLSVIRSIAEKLDKIPEQNLQQH